MDTTNVTFVSVIGEPVEHKMFEIKGVVRGLFCDRDNKLSALVEYKTADGTLKEEYWREEDIE